MSMRLKPKDCIFILDFISQAVVSWAQIAPPPDYDQKLGDMVVNATRSGTPLDEMSLNTTILTKEVLESSPDQTIGQVLKNVPGVFLNDVPYYQKDPTGQKHIARLADPSPEYLVTQLKNIRSGARVDMDGTMGSAARGLSDEDIEALAAYAASLN